MTRYIPLFLATLAAIFLVAPMAIIVPMSFSRAISFEFPPPGYWTGYYSQYFGSPAWLDATANSFIIATGSMVLTLAVALPAAFGFVRYRFYGKSMLNLLMMLPIIVPAVVSALGYYSFLSLVSLVGTRTGMIIAHSVLSIPIAFLAISAALKGFDRNLERAAQCVKQKRQASADFLGVPAVPRNVVGACCIPTTTLTDFCVREATFGVGKRGHQFSEGPDCLPERRTRRIRNQPSRAKPGSKPKRLQQKGRSDERCGL